MSRRKIVRTSGQTACRFAAPMSTATAYDEVRYSNYPYAQTHPDRLATVAALHGLSTPDPSTARVLEIGCGAAGNLIAMAVATPGISPLAAVHSHLAADGLAYVSYNANPGGYMRRALRDAGLWYAGDASAGVERAERAQALYRFLFENRAGTKDWWGGLLESQLEAFALGPTYRLVHDDLSDHWSPVWFADFAA